MGQSVGTDRREPHRESECRYMEQVNVWDKVKELTEKNHTEQVNVWDKVKELTEKNHTEQVNVWDKVKELTEKNHTEQVVWRKGKGVDRITQSR